MNGITQYPASMVFFGAGMSLRAGRVAFNPLLFDRFLTDRSAGAINNTAAEPGGSGAYTRTVSDTGSKATIANDEFTVASGASANTPTLVYSPAIARVAGQVLAAKCHIPDAGAFLFGWSSASNGLTQTYQFYGNLYELKIADGFSTFSRLTQDAPIWLALVLLDTGCMYFAFGGMYLGGMLLTHINRSGTTTPLYASWVHYTSSLHHNVTDVVTDSVVYTPTKLVTGLGVSGTLNVSDSGKTDHLTIAGLTRAGGNIGIVSRYTDANNYVITYHDGTNVKIDKVVAGSTTNVASVAKTYSAGADLEVIWNNETIRAVYNNSALNAVGYTISGLTGTQVGVYSTNAGNSISRTFDCYALGTGGEHSPLKSAVVRPQARPVVICDGDSLTAGDGLTFVQTYPYQLADALGRANYDVYNFGIGGQTIVQMSAARNTRITPHYGAWNGHTVVVWGGTNDLNGSATAAATYAVLAAHVNALLATGFRVIVLTMVKRGTSAPLETKRTDYNALINGTAGWEIIDVGARAEFSDATNLTYYQADQIHLTTAGYAVVAGLVSDAIV